MPKSYQDHKRDIYFRLHKYLTIVGECMKADPELALTDELRIERALDQVLRELKAQAGPDWPWK